MIKLKNVIHLYAGCRVVLDGKDKGILVGIDIVPNSVNQIYYNIVLDGEDPDMAIPYNDDYDSELRIKPILRPLSSMTADEADYFAWLCMDSEHHLEKDSRITQDDIQTELAKNDDGLMLDNDVEIYIGVTAGCFEGAVVIKTDGSIAVYDEDKDTYHPVDNIAFKVLYLLKQGFDLFGLIRAGLAIDSTILNPQGHD